MDKSGIKEQGGKYISPDPCRKQEWRDEKQPGANQPDRIRRDYESGITGRGGEIWNDLMSEKHQLDARIPEDFLYNRHLIIVHEHEIIGAELVELIKFA